MADLAWSSATGLSLATNVDFPTIAAGPGSLWVSWSQTIDGTGIYTSCATEEDGVYGDFSSPQFVDGSSTGWGSEIAVGPNGEAMVTWSQPGAVAPVDVYVSVAAGPGESFANPRAELMPTYAATSGVTNFTSIPALYTPYNYYGSNGIWSHPVLAWDRYVANVSDCALPGVVYLVYTDSGIGGNPDTDVLITYSSDDGATWSTPVTVHSTINSDSQFMPAVAVDPTTGNVAVTWYDTRADTTNHILIDVYGTVIAPEVASTPADFEARITAQPSDASNSDYDQELGEYMSVAFFGGRFYPIWSDNSSSSPPSGNMDLNSSKVTCVNYFQVTAGVSYTWLNTNIDVTVTAFDVFGNTLTGYSGTVHFTSTDSNASLPSNATLTSGIGTFSASFLTTGLQSITVTDLNNLDFIGTTDEVYVYPP